MPQASAPTFFKYPPPQREWAFAADARGRHLELLWNSVRAGGNGKLVDNPDFLSFVTALNDSLRASGSPSMPTGSGGAKCIPQSPVSPRLPIHLTSAAAADGADSKQLKRLTTTAAVVEVPAVTADARGLPREVTRCLTEAVLSAAECLCGEHLKDFREGCSTHGLAEVIWSRVLPTSHGSGGVVADPAVSRVEADLDRVGNQMMGGPGSAGHRVDIGDTATADASRLANAHSQEVAGEGRESSVGGRQAWRRECLVENLHALAAVTRWSHTREELARRGRSSVRDGGGGGGMAKVIYLLLDALCGRVTELKRQRNELFRSDRFGASANADG